MVPVFEISFAFQICEWPFVRYLDYQREIIHINFRTFNFGSGKGHSVLEPVETMRKVSGKDTPLQFTGRRNGDIASSVAKPLHAAIELK
jgi:UDP-glucose 4-epimerase